MTGDSDPPEDVSFPEILAVFFGGGVVGTLVFAAEQSGSYFVWGVAIAVAAVLVVLLYRLYGFTLTPVWRLQ